MSEIVGLQPCDSAVFCALHDQLTSLGRHAQLARCFSAVAELLINILSNAAMQCIGQTIIRTRKVTELLIGPISARRLLEQWSQ